MPSNLVKSKEDEALWSRAKSEASKTKKEKTPGFYALTTFIFEKMKNGKK